MQVSAVPGRVSQPSLQTLNRSGAQPAGIERLIPSSQTAAVSASAALRSQPRAKLGSEDAVLPVYREPGQQQRVGALQQGLAYAEQLGSALQGMKTLLSQTLVGATGVPGAALQDKQAKLQQLWQTRSDASAGQLDGQLQSVAEGATARQSFRIRGLDSQALSQGGVETLRLSLPGQTRSIAVPLDGQGLQRQVQSLQRALAPTAVQVDTQDGELVFSTTEAQWPALRDGMSLSGDGKRFPSGQMVRVLLEPQAQALTPSQWQLDDADGQRRALSQVLKAQERLKSAQNSMAADLADAANVAPSAQADTGAQVQAFAAGFAEQADVSALDYEQLRQLAPALIGLRRSQVQQLLSNAN